MGFVSINGFEIKISGGNGEVCISRDLYRLATRTDFFRMMSIYYSGPGFFINNAILMTTVYIQTWLLVVLALAGAYLVEVGDPVDVHGIFQDPLPSPGVGRRLADTGNQVIVALSSDNLITSYLRFEPIVVDEIDTSQPTASPKIFEGSLRLLVFAQGDPCCNMATLQTFMNTMTTTMRQRNTVQFWKSLTMAPTTGIKIMKPQLLRLQTRHSLLKHHKLNPSQR